MSRTRFVLIGGFLGAGKTTAMARLARQLVSQGRRVGLVTNDQAEHLVDTELLRGQGFDVGEVAGACFCCKFNDLVETVQRLAADQQPDVILAEPVGSCTDLVATVIEPLRMLHGDRYDLAPFTVLLKPEHGQKILRGQAEGGFSPKAEYIFLKQLEEADLVAVNKIDKLTADEQEELLRLIAERHPDKRALAVSARTGAGFDELLPALLESPLRRTAMDVDYDTYAEGEAELGWLNATVRMTALGQPLPLDELTLGLVAALRDALLAAQAEPAHLKILGQAGPDAAIANLVASDAAAELSLASQVVVPQAELIVNARVATAPETLDRFVQQAVADAARRFQATGEITSLASFRPGRPQPTHRLAVGG